MEVIFRIQHETQGIPNWTRVLALIGAYVSIRKILSILRILYVYFVRPAKSFAKHRGNWAVVTGASWGIGYGYAGSLAKRGMNVVLIARNGERLKEVSSELEEKFKVKTKVIVADFEGGDGSVYSTIEEELRGLNITMLVNNVGINTLYPKFFHETSVEDCEKMLYVNTHVPTRMAKMILPQMRERRFGTIINVSSSSAHLGQPTPLFAVYAGTKAFNQKFSMSLHEEVKKEGIEVLAVTPYFVTSKMSRTRKETFLICSENRNAEESLNKLGYGMQTVFPWFNHFMQYQITSSLSYFKAMSVRAVYSLRSRAIKKLAEKAESEKKSE